MPFLASLQFAVWIAGTFLVLFFLHFFWSDFPTWLYIPPVFFLYVNLFCCLSSRLLAWKERFLVKSGFVLFHAGIAVAIAGATATALYRFEGGFELARGQYFVDRPESYLFENHGAFWKPVFSGKKFQLQDILVEKNQEGHITELECRVTEGDDPNRPHDIVQNHPLKLDGGKVYLTKYLGRAIQFEARRRNREVSLGTVNFAEDQTRQSFQPPGSRYRLQVEFGSPGRQEILLTGFPGHVLRKKSLQPGESIVLDSVTLKYVGVVPWIGMTFVRDPGQPVMYVGFALFVTGLLGYYPFKLQAKGRA